MIKRLEAVRHGRPNVGRVARRVSRHFDPHSHEVGRICHARTVGSLSRRPWHFHPHGHQFRRLSKCRVAHHRLLGLRAGHLDLHGHEIRIRRELWRLRLWWHRRFPDRFSDVSVLLPPGGAAGWRKGASSAPIAIEGLFVICVRRDVLIHMAGMEAMLQG